MQHIHLACVTCFWRLFSSALMTLLEHFKQRMVTDGGAHYLHPKVNGALPL